MSTFQKATKLQSKLRAALFGPSGSGKTFTALRIAKGLITWHEDGGLTRLDGKIAVIDTERGSASKYSDRFSFDVCELQDRSINGYCKVIADAGKANYAVLIIDSLSHGWQELLERVEKLAQAKYRGNTWSAWSEGTPEQRQLVNAILDFPGHVIATMRSKTEWTTAKQDNGKSAPVRVGLAPEQGKGIEYEFDLLLELTVEHVCNVLKDRTGKFQDRLIDKPGEDFGKELAAWLSEGEAAPTREVTQQQAVSIPAGSTQPQLVSGESNEIAWNGLVVVNAEAVSGETRGKKWTYFKVTFEGGKIASTFSETINKAALLAGKASEPVNCKVKPGKKADTWELLSLETVDEIPV